jgi:hypothetical protein
MLQGTHNDYGLTAVDSEDTFVNPHDVHLNKFIYFNNETSFDQLEENTENLRNFKFLFSSRCRNAILGSST